MNRSRFSAGLSRPLALTATLALLFATSACSENRPFERESAGAQAKLAVPTSLTPPISVKDVAGAPADWKLAERVAEALRSRDIPASAASRSRSAYVLKGELRQGTVRNGRSRVEVAWTLFDGAGRKIGDVTQMAAVPGGAFKVSNDGVVEAMADAAAESIAPLVPSSSVELADGAETGERKPNDRARAEDRDRVTALGRMANNTGVARNLLDPKTRPAKIETRAEAATHTTARSNPPPSGPVNIAGDKTALTAVGRYQGTSALSRNLLRPGADVSRPLPAPRVNGPTRPPRPAVFEAEESLGMGRPMRAVTEPAIRVPAARVPAAREPAARIPPAESIPSLPSASTSRPAQRAEADTVRPETDIPYGHYPRQLAESTDPAPRPIPAATGAAQYWVQIAANRDEAASRAEWQRFRTQGGALFDGTGNRIQRADLGARGVFYRIQVGPFDSAREAGQFCAQLKGQQIDCFLAPPERAMPAARARPAPAAKPAEAKPKAVTTAPPAPKAPPAAALPSPPANIEPAEKPKDTASNKKPDVPAAKPAAKPESKPPANASAEKPDAPISTAPGLPGVLD